MEKRILRWTEETSRPTLSETNRHSLLKSDNQRNRPRQQKMSEWLPDIPQMNQSNSNKDIKIQKQSNSLNQMAPGPEITTHNSHELSEQRNSKRFAYREKQSLKQRNVIEEQEEEDDEETQVTRRKYPVDVYPEPKHRKLGYDNRAFVGSPRSERKDFPENSAKSHDDILNVSKRSKHGRRPLHTKSPNNRHQFTTGEIKTMDFDYFHNDHNFHSPIEDEDSSDEDFVEPLRHYRHLGPMKMRSKTSVPISPPGDLDLNPEPSEIYEARPSDSRDFIQSSRWLSGEF